MTISGYCIVFCGAASLRARQSNEIGGEVTRQSTRKKNVPLAASRRPSLTFQTEYGRMLLCKQRSTRWRLAHMAILPTYPTLYIVRFPLKARELKLDVL
jgi:hypothetical protein